MRWNEFMWRLVKLAKLVADEKLEMGGLYGVLRFFSDGWVYGSNGVFEFELRCGVDFDGVVSASKFYDVCKVLDKRIAYDVGVDDGYLYIRGDGTEVKIDMLQVDANVNRIIDVISENEEFMKGVGIEWREDVVEVIKRMGKIASSGGFGGDVVCFDNEGIYATDRVRIACCFMPFVSSDGRMLLSVKGVKQLIDVAEEERVIGAWVLGIKLYIKFDDNFYVSVIGYDIDFPDLKGVFERYIGSVRTFYVDKVVADEISNIVQTLDQADVVYLVVSDGWLWLNVKSVRGFELRRRLQVVSVDGEYEVGVLAKDIDGVISGVMELGFSDVVLYCKSEEGVEYIVATMNR